METKSPRVLIVTPTANHKDYCLKDWAKSISELTYKNLDILILDNSEDKEHVKEFAKYEFRENTYIVHVERNDSDKDIRYLMARCNEMSRRFALNKGYDFILSLESDVFPPCKNAVEILLSHNKEVVGFDYFIGHYHLSHPVVFNRLTENSYFTCDVQPSLLSGFLSHNGKLNPVPNLGLGFLLISKTVFCEFEFKIDDEVWHIDNDNFAHFDTFFHLELNKRGIPIYCDSRYMLEHRNQNWRNILEKEKI